MGSRFLLIYLRLQIERIEDAQLNLLQGAWGIAAIATLEELQLNSGPHGSCVISPEVGIHKVVGNRTISLKMVGSEAPSAESHLPFDLEREHILLAKIAHGGEIGADPGGTRIPEAKSGQTKKSVATKAPSLHSLPIARWSSDSRWA